MQELHVLIVLVIHSLTEETYCIVFISQYFIIISFKYKDNLKKLYNEHPCSHHVDSTIDNVLYLLYHISNHLSNASDFHDHVKLPVLTKSIILLKSITFT